MKRYVSLAVCLMMLLFACGCTGNQPTQGGPAETPAPVDPPIPQQRFSAYALSQLIESSWEDTEALMGTVVQITGKASYVQGGLSIDRETQLGYFVCRMAPDSQDYSEVQRGDVVSVVGTLTEEFSMLYLEDCYYLGMAVEQEMSGPLVQPGFIDAAADYPLAAIGELIERTEYEQSVILQYRIPYAGNSGATIQQNYHIIQNFILGEGGEAYETMQYIGIMHLDGEDQRVISFKMGQPLIQQLREGTIAATMLGDYVEDLWIDERLRAATPEDAFESAASTPTPQPILIQPTPSPTPVATPTPTPRLTTPRGSASPTPAVTPLFSNRVVYKTTQGNAYHEGDCPLLAGDRIALTAAEAYAERRTPCTECNPASLIVGY